MGFTHKTEVALKNNLKKINPEREEESGISRRKPDNKEKEQIERGRENL